MMPLSFSSRALASTSFGRHSALEPAGEIAARIDSLWHVMLWVSVAVYVLVMIALGIAVFRRHRCSNRRTGTDPCTERLATRVVAVATGATVAILFVFLFFDFFTGRAIAQPDGVPFRVSIVGRQWWWEVTYENDSTPQQQLVTANEMHVPVGRPMQLLLTSRDVIHSFWIPNLNGKTDLVPGYESRAWFVADTPGVYRGQCAEFCGLQHSKMGFTVIAESQEKFERWYAGQLTSAARPGDSLRKAGETLFMSGTCASCHTIRGTSAGGRAGPELTHVGSQSTIAAGALPNTPKNMARWITDAQRIKPGSMMPSQHIPAHELRLLVAYLEGLR
jgi:cytochrome c oxidase subunit 2